MKKYPMTMMETTGKRKGKRTNTFTTTPTGPRSINITALSMIPTSTSKQTSLLRLFGGRAAMLVAGATQAAQRRLEAAKI